MMIFKLKISDQKKNNNSTNVQIGVTTTGKKPLDQAKNNPIGLNNFLAKKIKTTNFNAISISNEMKKFNHGKLGNTSFFGYMLMTFLFVFTFI